MTDREFSERLSGAGLLTAEILYGMPDHPTILQTFCFQTLDLAPKYPKLHHFLDHWRREIEAVIHSIRVAHADWVGPAEVNLHDAEFRLN